VVSVSLRRGARHGICRRPGPRGETVAETASCAARAVACCIAGGAGPPARAGGPAPPHVNTGGCRGRARGPARRSVAWEGWVGGCCPGGHQGDWRSRCSRHTRCSGRTRRCRRARARPAGRVLVDASGGAAAAAGLAARPAGGTDAGACAAPAQLQARPSILWRLGCPRPLAPPLELTRIEARRAGWLVARPAWPAPCTGGQCAASIRSRSSSRAAQQH
jgi:hypothetical protein